MDTRVEKKMKNDQRHERTSVTCSSRGELKERRKSHRFPALLPSTPFFIPIHSFLSILKEGKQVGSGMEELRE